MMRVLLLIGIFSVLSSVSMAQDFASRFRNNNENDSVLTCVTISPKMMQEILNNESDKDDDILEMISELKSMQMCTSPINGQHYYDRALEVIERNSKLFEPFLSFNDTSGNFQIVVRKKRDTIIELVMLIHQNDGFALINFTGKMNAKFISKLAESVRREKTS